MKWLFVLLFITITTRTGKQVTYNDSNYCLQFDTLYYVHVYKKDSNYGCGCDSDIKEFIVYKDVKQILMRNTH